MFKNTKVKRDEVRNVIKECSTMLDTTNYQILQFTKEHNLKSDLHLSDKVTEND